MAHVHALGDSCPKAKGIIHLGMTSQDVVCNADLNDLCKQSVLIERKARTSFVAAREQASRARGGQYPRWDSHTTSPRSRSPLVAGSRSGRRTLRSLVTLLLGWYGGAPSEGSPGRHGYAGVVRSPCSVNPILRIWARTCSSSFPAMERARMGRHRCGWCVVSSRGQTYPRVIRCQGSFCLAVLAAVLHKIATDIRLLCNRKEIDEPFEDKQIGSSRCPTSGTPCGASGSAA
jgi:adenylosuccinate lyase